MTIYLKINKIANTKMTNVIINVINNLEGESVAEIR